jgi:large subunit ribosomal protein L22
MTGPKLNEGATIAGERVGTKATAKYVRSSARKARVVLDLIRGLEARRADEVLQFTDRGIAREVRKVLASAVANAVHNDGQDPEELFVLACFADEGPTLRRFRPRARGRASRIRKRTCHITVIVSRMGEQRLAVVQAREESAGAGGRPTSASRRARVQRSRQQADEAKEAIDAVDADEAIVDAAEDLEAELPAGGALPLEDGSAPEGFAIKGNADSMLYHEPDSRYYEITKAEMYFDSAESAEAAGFAKPAAASDSSDAATDTASGDEDAPADEKDNQ